MAQFWIEDSDLIPLKDKVVVVTGGSSGIGLATVKLLLELGSKVVAGDQNPSPIEHANLSSLAIDVTSWPSLKSLFAHAKDTHGRIDHTFSNAGISGRAEYLEDKYSPTGDLLEPATLTYDVNLRGMINTSYLGMHHMRHQDPPGGSIVCTASATSFNRFAVWDYATTKHGVMGFMRGAIPNLQQQSIPIRMNCIGPNWTQTDMVKGICDAAGVQSQSAEVVARNVALLMADERRQGQLIYSADGKYYEIEEAKLLPVAVEVYGLTGQKDQGALDKLGKLAQEIGVREGQAADQAAGSAYSGI